RNRAPRPRTARTRRIPRRAPERPAAAALRRPAKGRGTCTRGPRGRGIPARRGPPGRAAPCRALACFTPGVPALLIFWRLITLRPMDLATAAKRMSAYERLIRLDKPIGAALLLWPTLWAVWIAPRGWPSTEVVLVFVTGTILMRSAGCALND